MVALDLERRSPVLARMLRTFRLPSARGFWRLALDGLVEAQELAAAAPDDPARRDIVETLEEVFLAACRTTFARDTAIQVWWRSTLISALDCRLANTSPEIAEHIRAALRILADERDVVHVFVQSDEGFLLETYASAPRDVADKGVS